MKLKVLTEFVDRLTGDLRHVGEVFEADAERAEQLIARGRLFVEQVDEPEAAKPVAHKKQSAKKSAKK